MNIIDLTSFIINKMTQPFLLMDYFVGRKDRCETTKHKTLPKSYCTRVIELLSDITFLIDPSQCVLLKRLKDHIDINCKLRRTDKNCSSRKKSKKRTAY